MPLDVKTKKELQKVLEIIRDEARKVPNAFGLVHIFFTTTANIIERVVEEIE